MEDADLNGEAIMGMRQVVMDGLGVNCTFVDDNVRLIVALAQRAILAGLDSDVSDDMRKRFSAAAESARADHESALGYKIRSISHSRERPA